MPCKPCGKIDQRLCGRLRAPTMCLRQTASALFVNGPNLYRRELCLEFLQVHAKLNGPAPL